MPIKWFNSLQKKITLLYLIGVLFMGLLIYVSYETFSSANFILTRSEKISEFVENVLEMRRYEKNFFLYHHSEDLRSIESYLLKAKNIFTSCYPCFQSLTGSYNYKEVNQALEDYGALLKNITEKGISKIYFEELREKGRYLTGYAEWMNKLKEKQIKESLNELKNWIFFTLGIFLVLIFLYGLYLYHSLRRPIQKLENYIFQISQGKFCAVPPDFEDREMILLVEAINKMLAEIDKRTEYLIQTERLATFGTLLFSLAHELNNPLNNIYTSCQILKEEIEEDNTEFKKNLLLEMEKEIERTQNIIRSILDYSKPSSKEEIRLKSLLEETLYLLKGKLPRNVEIIFEIPEDFTIVTDPQQMKQVFINLFKNAFDAIGDREGKIQIRGEKSSNYAILYFSDTGPGIPAKVLPHIFDPFFTTKEGKRGYGLGLFIVYNLIQNHGGSIEVESEVGKGTTFIIKIPEKEEVKKRNMRK
jgi:signal transduction histidine kinase